MMKNYEIKVEGNRNQRAIVKEIIYKYVDEYIKTNLEHQYIGCFERVNNTRKDVYYEQVTYEFRTTGRAYKKIKKELKKIGIDVKPYLNKRSNRVIMDQSWVAA